MIGFGKLKFVGTSASDALYVRDFMILQPMPSRLGWLAHYLPLPIHRLLLKGMWFTEMVAPFLLFFPWSAYPCGSACASYASMVGDGAAAARWERWAPMPSSSWSAEQPRLRGRQYARCSKVGSRCLNW